jgi:hypothetical protein
MGARKEKSLLEEIFSEADLHTELLEMEIYYPLKQEFRLVANTTIKNHIKAISDSIQRCLQIQIKGIRHNKLENLVNTELVFELNAPVQLNRKMGNNYRDAIYRALTRCNKFKKVYVEGSPDFNNRIATKYGPRFVDIAVETKDGYLFFIEVKRGDSFYGPGQWQKDQLIKKNYRIPTFVIRGVPK